MATSKTLSALIGPALIAIAASILFNANSLPALIGQFAHDPALIWISGMTIFVVGLAIVRAHNIWSGSWVVVAVTVIGWLLLVGGLMRILFPFQLAAIAGTIGQDTGFIVVEAVILLVIGGFLAIEGSRQG